MECIACKKPKRSALILRTKHWRAILASDQGCLGRCYVVLGRHCSDMAKLKLEEWIDFSEVVQELECALRKAFDATMFNWACFMNYAYQLDPPNPHVHWHLVPRYKQKVKFAGMTFEDPKFGQPYDLTRTQVVPPEVKQKIVTRIKENLRLTIRHPVFSSKSALLSAKTQIDKL